MSVDTQTGPNNLSLVERVNGFTPEELHETLEGILAATTGDDASEQQPGFEKVAKLYLEEQENHAAAINTSEEQPMEQVLEAMLEDPAKSFLSQFQQLRLLYADRTVYAQMANGAQIATFCTQNHETHERDYTFKMRVGTDGIPVYSASKLITASDGSRRQLQFRSLHGELKISSPGYNEKGAPHTEYLEGEQAEEQLATLFHDTMTASGLQLDRAAHKPAELKEYDEWAKSHMQAEYEGIKQTDGFQTDTIVLE